MPHSPVGTYNFRAPDAEDGSNTLPKRRRQTNLRCATTQMQEDLQQSAAKAEILHIQDITAPSQRRKIQFLP